MNELIKVNYDNADRPTVSGRELWEALEVETPYKKWFDRMAEYGFSENLDFWTNLSESTGGQTIDRPPADHSHGERVVYASADGKGEVLAAVFYQC